MFDFKPDCWFQQQSRDCIISVVEAQVINRLVTELIVHTNFICFDDHNLACNRVLRPFLNDQFVYAIEQIRILLVLQSDFLDKTFLQDDCIE